MNKKMRELMGEIEKQTALASGYMEGETKDVAKANEIMDKVDGLKSEYETEKRIFEMSKLSEGVSVEPEIVEPKDAPAFEQKVSGAASLAKAVRAMATGKALQEGVDANGGYAVPEDIQTQINKWKELHFSLEDEISIEKVSTNKGARTYQKRGTAVVFADVEELGEIGEIAAPTFERVKFDIKDRAGFMPVSNDLLDDSDQNITAVMVEWLGQSDQNTSNAEIVKCIKKNDEKDLKDLDGIKKAVIKDLEVFAGTVTLYTNADGIAYLDTLKDADGRYILNPDPTDAAKMTLRCGATVIPVKQVPSTVLATGGENKVPFVLGSLKDGIKKFDRQAMTLATSNVASIGSVNAFGTNQTVVRGIVRNDFEVLDKTAFVNGFITVGE